MILSLYVLLFIAIIIAWCGVRKPAIYGYLLIIVLASVIFIHHLTTPLTLQL